MQDVRLARVSTIPFFVFTQLRSQLESLADSGIKVSIVSSADELSDSLSHIKGCTFKPIHIAREITLVPDLLALIQLWRLFRKEGYHLIHSTTPKAGLLCAIAAKLAGVPVCIHTFTGQPWVTMSGMRKKLVQWSDKLIARLNTRCYTDSFSQRDFLVANKIAAADKLKVIGSGSLAGVDTQRFSQDNFSATDKQKLKNSLNIDLSSKVLLFIGRITKEKGIFELLEAVHTLLKNNYPVTLIIVGPFDQNNEQEIRAHAQALCGNKVVFTGFQTAPERFIAISDVLCLPSYREGFGTVVLEAAAMGVPTLGSDIYGLSDAVIDGKTGILVEPRQSAPLAEALMRLLSDEPFRVLLGEQAKNRVIKEFDSRHYNQLLIDEYKQLLATKDL